MNKKKVCCWDLEGPISVLDFAAEIGKMLQKKPNLNLQGYDMGEFFYMVSNYDDYLIDTPGVKQELGIPEYQPGDTLRLMAPFYVASFTDEELINLAQSNLGLLPGCKKLMEILHKEWDVYVISTSYTHFALNVTAALGILKDHVYCTDLNIKQLKEDLTSIKFTIEVLVHDIFQRYLKNNRELNSVIDDLNNFFWKGMESEYTLIMNKVKVRGGKRKELAVEEIADRTRIPISEMIALGDSITDINMLQRIKDEGGVAVSFNGNRFSVERATIAINTPNSLGVLPIFQNKDIITQFLTEWEENFDICQNNPKNINKGLISEECRDYFINTGFVPEIVDLTNKSREQLKGIILNQEKTRKVVRGWAGKLG